MSMLYRRQDQAIYKVNYQRWHRLLPQSLEPELRVVHKEGLQVLDEHRIHDRPEEDVRAILPRHSLFQSVARPVIESDISWNNAC